MFEVSAQVESPLAISTRRATGFDIETLVHIPAVAFRGALAATYLHEHGSEPDQGFHTLFLAGKVRYGDLRPEGALHWPLSSRECTVSARHPLVDLLLAASTGTLPREECVVDGCRHKRKLPESFRRSAGPAIESVKVNTRRIAHVQIDDDLRRASGGLLHSAQVIDAGQTFEGRITAEPAAEPVLRKFLGQRRTIYIGRGRTRGQGRIGLSAWETSDTADSELRQRLEGLNRRATLFPALASPSRICFTVTLQSPAIVFDRWLLSRPYLTAADVSEELSDYRLLACFARSLEISGWHAKAGMPKSEIAAIAPGSSFLFGLEWRDSATRLAEFDRIVPILDASQTRGVGERLQEGFGEFIACDSFHFENAAGANE
jgi:hypothetical protein